MELNRALGILDLVSIGGGGRAVDVKKNPRAIGMMGLAPFEVEQTGVDEAKVALTKYLEQYPEAERDRVRQELFSDYREIQKVRGSGCR